MKLAVTAAPERALPSVVTLIEQAEEWINHSAQQQLHHPDVLVELARAWRTWTAGFAALPDEVRGLARPIALHRGGNDHPGGLGDDYPAGLLELTRSSWAIAASGLALMQQAVPPYSYEDTRQLHALATRLAAVSQPAFAPTPCRVALVTDDYRLREIAPDAGATGEPILVISSLINRWYILDFLADQSFVAMLRGLGHPGRPVYVLEWSPPKADDDRGLGELCAGPVLEATDWIRARHRVPSVAVIGYSMGGTIATCLAARYPDRVSRLATVCAPVRFERGGSFTQWLSPRFVDVELIARAWNRVPAPLVHAPFWWLRPSIQLHKLALLARAFERASYLEQFIATEVWNHDNVELSRGAFRSWVGDLYQRNALVAGSLIVGGQAVQPARIAGPVLIVSAASDNIAPPAAVEGLAELCPPGAARVLRVDSGHVGVLTSRRALATQAAAFRTWLDTRSEAS